MSFSEETLSLIDGATTRRVAVAQLYEVGGSEVASFRTAAGPDQMEFSFVVFGDTRTGHAHHQAVADRILALRPDFAIHTGDLVNDAHTEGHDEPDCETLIAHCLVARQAPVYNCGLGNCR